MQNQVTKSRVRSYWYDPEGLKRTYGVVLKSKDVLEKKEKQVHYEIEVLFLEKYNIDDFIFEVRKKQVFIDEKKPDLLFDVLADDCGKILYPVKVIVSPLGKLRRIANYQEIKERWFTKRNFLAKQYQGGEVDLLFNQMDQVINNEQKINSIVKEDWFFTLFFNQIHGGYASTVPKAALSLIFYPYSEPVVFETKQTGIDNPNKPGAIIYKQEGHCVDVRNEAEIQKGKKIFFSDEEKKEKVKGNVTINYEIYKDSPVFDAIWGSGVLEFSSGKSKEIVVEIFNLKNKIPKSSLEEDILQDKIKEAKPKPKKHFSFFGIRKKR
ncbi:hypothetical protein [Tenacibaculum dicentrarchi]|uniref:hypothetical protein n=1 Tax=Tenacibaculum dicentrarchi TaxID=669041 RepID=UPI001BE6D6F4